MVRVPQTLVMEIDTKQPRAFLRALARETRAAVRAHERLRKLLTGKRAIALIATLRKRDEAIIRRAVIAVKAAQQRGGFLARP